MNTQKSTKQMSTEEKISNIVANLQLDFDPTETIRHDDNVNWDDVTVCSVCGSKNSCECNKESLDEESD